MESKILPKDNVDKAIQQFNRPLLLGRIEEWEDIFEKVQYQPNTPPYEGRNFFPLVTNVHGSKFFDMKQGIQLCVKPSTRLLAVIRSAHGNQLMTNPLTSPFRERYQQLDSISGFRLIAWEAAGVVLIKASRTDHSDFGTYIGFIDIAKVPKITPADAEEAKQNRASRNTSPSM